MSPPESAFARLERLAARLPGFNDYRDLDALRETDRQTRANIAAKLEQTAARIERSAQPLVTNQQFAAITEIERLLRSLRLAAVRLESASQGYAPLFSDRTVDANVLQQVLAFDEALSVKADLISSEAETFISTMGGDDIASGSEAVNHQIEALLAEFSRRSTILASGTREAGHSLGSVYGRSEPGWSAVIELEIGDVVSIANEDFVIEASIVINGIDSMATGYLLDARNRRWLVLTPGSESPFVLAGENEAVSGSSSNEPAYILQGAGTLRDPDGRSNLGIITLQMSTPADESSSAERIIQLTSSNDTITLSGTPIDADAITIYGQPG